MSPLFALDLSLDGIRLLYRAEGGWTVVGDVALEDPALNARLAELRAAAKDLAPGALATELVIPPSQIRYATVPRPHDGEIGPEDLLPALSGLTAIPPEEIAFDFEVDGEDVRLALVDTLTLSEAETFAAAHKFNPMRFGARPTPAQFSRPADFGPTARAAAARATAAPAPAPVAAEPAPIPAAEEPAQVEETPDPAPAFASIRAAAGAPPEPVAIALPGKLTLAVDAPLVPEDPAAPTAQSPAEAERAPDALAAEATTATEAPFTEVPTADEATALPEPEDLARTLTAPRPEAPEAAGAATGAAALARTLVAERAAPRAPARPARRPAAPMALPKPRRLAVAGAGLAAVALVLSFALTRDPADALPDTPPEVALAAPALGVPDGATPQAAPAAPATEAEGAPATLAAAEIAAPEATADPVADTAAPATLEDEAPSLLLASAPAGLPLPATEGTEAIYLASIDPDTATSDAIALLPAARFSSSPRPASPLSPAPAGTTFDRGADGLVVATPDGALTPDGVVVRAGRPPLAPPPAPNRPAPDAVAAAPAEAAEVVIATTEPEVRPRARPTGLVERFERATLGGRTRAELAALKPQARPVSEQAQAVAAAPTEPSDYAVAVSIAPRDRPENFAARIATVTAVAAALAAPPPPPPAPEPAPVVVAAAPAAAPAPAPAPAEAPARAQPSEADEYADGEPEVASAAPDIPTTASVARQATLRNAMDLGDVNLIGVYGTERDRRALVRLPSGRMVKVEVGDRLDGGRIAAIGRDELRYTKGGRNITLEVPEG